MQRTRKQAPSLLRADGLPCDASTNQINGPGSCFYDADMRDVEEPFTDAYVEVVARWEGSGAVPYLPEAVFDAGGAALRVRFSKLWFSHWTEDPGEAL
ncbi:MAG: hypothetical protein ACOYZ8_19570, partial [Chloroflexota bacterium]